MGEREYIEGKLLGLFHELMTEFHTLSGSYKNIEENVKKLQDIGRDTKDTYELIHDFNKNSAVIQKCWDNIEKSVGELVQYKNSLGNVHQMAVDGNNDIIKKLDLFIPLFDNTFFESTKKIKDYNEIKKDLDHVIKLSKILVTPVGIFSFIVIFTLGLFATSTGVYKVFQLFAPPKIEQKNYIEMEESLKRIEGIIANGSSGIKPEPPSKRH